MLMLVLASSASIVRIVARLTEELVEKRTSVSVKLVISIAHGGSVVSRPGGAGQAIDERGSSTVRGASDRHNVSGGGGGQRTSVGAGRGGVRRRWRGRLASEERRGGSSFQSSPPNSSSWNVVDIIHSCPFCMH